MAPTTPLSILPVAAKISFVHILVPTPQPATMYARPYDVEFSEPRPDPESLVILQRTEKLEFGEHEHMPVIVAD